MNGVERCLICGVLTSGWTFLGTWSGGALYSCDNHIKEARAQAGRLKQSDAAMGNKNASKKRNK